MIKILLLTFLVLATFSTPNQRPIIGIYTQNDQADASPSNSSNTIQTYIAASYVKFIEMAGAQVVPIYAYSTQQEIGALLSQVNGVLFPGGGMSFDLNDTWTANANFIFQYAIQQNDKGNIFPIWGTCQGHLLLAYLTCNGDNPVNSVCNQQNMIDTIQFPSSNKGYLFNGMSKRLITKLTTGPGMTFYDHVGAVLTSVYENNEKLNSFWAMTAETTTSCNQTFVAAWEAKKYPFYSVQFHPEKSNFEWKVYSDKSNDSVQVTQILANRFVAKARLSTHKYAKDIDFQQTSINNFKTYNSVMAFTSIYLFEEAKQSITTVRTLQQSRQLKREQ